MKTTKRLLVALLAALLTLSLVACNKDDTGVNIPASQKGSDDFQKNMHQSTSDSLRTVTETDNGFYIQLKGAYVYYIDKATKNITILCGKPECEHNDETCNARLYAGVLWFAGDKLYFTNSNYIMENGSYVNYGRRLYSVDPNGENRRVVQKLQFTPGGDTSSWKPYPIQHRGIVYFPYSGILYAMPLGGDIEKDAVAIWGEESADTGMSFNLSAPAYTLWADGDFMYFMVTNMEQSDGTRKETLFAYDTRDNSVKQVWQVPDADEVGEWTTTGVSVTQWYIIDGYIYFYLSGGDFWRSDLTSGKTEKLADTHEKTKYGTAIFSDDYLFLLNSTPEDLGGTSHSIVGGQNYIGGDTIYIFKMNGEFVKELSLKSLYDAYDALTKCELAFCSGTEIYFTADASTKVWSGNVGTMNWNCLLYCISIETGEITQIFNW